MNFAMIAFDGMGYESLVEPYIDSHMPFYRKLRDGDGVYGGYESVYRLTFPSWMSIYTGLKKERHLVKQGLNSLLTRPPEKTYWEVLGEAGLTQGVFHMPLTYPPTRLNGWMVSGFPSPTEDEEARMEEHIYCFPAKHMAWLDGYYRTIDDWGLVREKHGYAQAHSILDAVESTWQQNFTVLDRFMHWKRVDCLSLGYQFPDFINHTLGPRESEAHFRLEREVKKRLCKVIDEITAEIIDRYEPERFLICADHGFYYPESKDPDLFAHAPDGALFIGGEGVRNCPVPKGVHEWDLYDLILKLCDVHTKGFPVLERELSESETKSIEKKLEALGYM